MDALKTKELARMLRHHAEGGDARAVNLVQKTLWMLSFLEDSADEIPTATGDELCVPIKGRLLSLEGLLELVAREANANVSIKGSHFKTARETEEALWERHAGRVRGSGPLWGFWLGRVPRANRGGAIWACLPRHPLRTHHRPPGSERLDCLGNPRQARTTGRKEPR